MSRKTLETEGDFLNNEPYKSIINILKIAPEFDSIYSEGMKTKELMDLIIEVYSICKKRADKQRLETLSELRKYILSDETKKIRLNQDIKLGRYKEKQNQNIKQGEYERKTLTTTYYHLFNEYLKRLEKFGWIKRENGFCSFNKKHEFLLFRHRQKDVIMKTDLKRTIFHPSPGHSFTYYAPRIPTSYLKYSIKELDSRVKKVEGYLKEAQNEWLGILSEAQNNFLGELWKQRFLQNKGIFILTKFDFCLDIIFDKRILWLLDVTPPEKTTDEQWDFLMDIKKRALDKYLQKKYPTLSLSGIEKLHKKMQSGHKSKEKIFEGIRKEIKDYGYPMILEHIIVLDFLGTSKVKHDELVAKGVIPSTSLDRDKPVGKIYGELKKSSEKGYPYDTLENKGSSEEYAVNSVNEKLYVETPFFKKFFKGFEKDLTELGFKKKELEDFYNTLDETAEILRMPLLPDDPADLV